MSRQTTPPAQRARAEAGRPSRWNSRSGLTLSMATHAARGARAAPASLSARAFLAMLIVLLAPGVPGAQATVFNVGGTDYDIVTTHVPPAGQFNSTSAWTRPATAAN